MPLTGLAGKPARRRLPHELGTALSHRLRRAWDPSLYPEPPSVIDQEVLALLLRGAAGGLAYYPLREVNPERFPLAAVLKDQHRIELMHARLRERCLGETVDLLRAAGVESVLIKGWAIARMYPDPGMRPYGDLDLCVRNADYLRASGALENRGEALVPVEIHPEGEYQGDIRYGELFAPSRLVELNGVQVRVPSEEQHLRLLALHLLAHGGWRPQWLCDVAVAVEKRQAGFDWDRCFHGEPVYTRWVRVILLLAQRLLGADLSGTPVEGAGDELPSWAVSELLAAWGCGRSPNMDAPPIVYLRDGGPVAFIRAVRANWRNGLQASYELRVPPNNFPRMPVRLAASLARSPRVLRAIRGVQLRGMRRAGPPRALDQS